jgi:hypothetical protein
MDGDERFGGALEGAGEARKADEVPERLERV